MECVISTGSSRTGSSRTDTRSGSSWTARKFRLLIAATFSVNETVREASIASLRTNSTQWLIDYQLLSTQSRLTAIWLSDALTAAKLFAAVLPVTKLFDWKGAYRQMTKFELFGENVAQVDGLTWRGAPRRKTADVDGSCTAVTGDGWSSLE